MERVNETNHDDVAAWCERLTTHVNMAAEPIHALPFDAQSRALAMLVAIFERELKPLPTGRWGGSHHSRSFARRREGQ